MGFKMSPDTTSRSLWTVIIRAILADSLNTTLEYIMVTGALVIWPSAISLALHLKYSILILNTMWHCTNWCPMGASFPSHKISNATLTFSSSLFIASAHKVLLIFAIRTRACSIVLGSSMPNLWLVVKYQICCFLMLAIILSLFLSTS